MAKTLTITPYTDSVGLATVVAVNFTLNDGSSDLFHKIVPIASLQVLYDQSVEQLTVNSGGSHLLSYDATNVLQETGQTTVNDLYDVIKNALFV